MSALAEIIAWVGQPLPEVYRQYLAASSDDLLAENDRTLIYGSSSFVERNETYEVREYCPGNVTIGDDSGGAQIMLCLQDGSIHRTDAGAMTPDCFERLADSFGDWQALGFPYEATYRPLRK